MKKYIALINDFAHDFFTGLWIACLVALYLIQKKSNMAHLTEPASSSIVQSLQHDFFWLQTWSMALIILTGVGRYIHVKQTHQQDSYDPQRKTLLIVKHIVLGILFVGGSYLGYIWR